MRGSLALAALVLGVLALVAAGCGGGDDEELSQTEQWASGFCTSVTTWTDSLSEVGDSLSDASSLSADALNDAEEDLSAATETFVDEVRGLGSPGTEAGDEVESSLEALGETLDTETAKIQEAVEDASGLTGLASAISAVGTSLTAMGTAFQTALGAIEDADVEGELEAAFESTPACDELTNR
jgi:hypothetical protein